MASPERSLPPLEFLRGFEAAARHLSFTRFRCVHPNVDVRIKATHEVVDLEREGIDVAIRDCAPSRAPPGAIFLVGEHLMPVCSPEYLREAKREKRPLSRPADLRHHV